MNRSFKLYTSWQVSIWNWQALKHALLLKLRHKFVVGIRKQGQPRESYWTRQTWVSLIQASSGKRFDISVPQFQSFEDCFVCDWHFETDEACLWLFASQQILCCCFVSFGGHHTNVFVFRNQIHREAPDTTRPRGSAQIRSKVRRMPKSGKQPWKRVVSVIDFPVCAEK